MKKIILVSIIIIGLSKTISTTPLYLQQGHNTLQQAYTQARHGNFPNARALIEEAINYFKQAFNSFRHKDPRKLLALYRLTIAQHALHQLTIVQLDKSTARQEINSQVVESLTRTNVNLIQLIDLFEERLAQIERTVSPGTMQVIEEKLQQLHAEVGQEQAAQKIARRPAPEYMYL